MITMTQNRQFHMPHMPQQANAKEAGRIVRREKKVLTKLCIHVKSHPCYKQIYKNTAQF